MLSHYPQVFRFCKSSGAMLDVVDACSLLYRLKMEGKIWVNQKNRQARPNVETFGVNGEDVTVQCPIRNIQVLVCCRGL